MLLIFLSPLREQSSTLALGLLYFMLSLLAVCIVITIVWSYKLWLEDRRYQQTLPKPYRPALLERELHDIKQERRSHIVRVRRLTGEIVDLNRALSRLKSPIRRNLPRRLMSNKRDTIH